MVDFSATGLHYGGTISGSGSVVASATGTVTLSGPNTHTGGTSVTAGTLQVGSDAALGAPAAGLTINSAFLRASASFVTARNVTFGISGGSVDMTDKTVFLEFAGNVSGSTTNITTLTKWSAGTLTWSGTANPFSGSISVREGVFRVTNPGAVQNVTSGRISVSTAGVLAIGYSTSAVFGKLSSTSTGVLALTGDTTATVSAPANMFIGAWGGPVTASGPLQLFSTSYRLGGGASSPDGGSVGTLTVASNLSVASAGLIVGTGNPLSGYGTVVLAGANTYGGGTTVNPYAVLRIDMDGRLGAAGASLTLGGGTLQAGAAFTASRPVALTTPSAVDTAGFDVTLSGPVTGSGGATLTKVGAGTLTLAGVNTFAGGTNVQDGTVEVAADSALGAGPVTAAAVGTVSFAGPTTTGRSFDMGGGSVTVAAGRTLTVNGGRVSNAVLGGPGMFATGGAGGAFANATSLPSATITSASPADRFLNFTDGGVLAVAGGVAGPVALTGFVVSGGGSLEMAAGGKANAANFQSYGTVRVDPGTATAVTILTNVGAAPLYFNGGSRTFVGTPATAANAAAVVDLNGKNAVVAGGLFVNNGVVYDNSTGNFQGPGAVIADFGALVKGSGAYAVNVVTQNGGRFQAGNSPGRAAHGSLILGPGGIRNDTFQVNNAAGTAGPTADATGLVSGWTMHDVVAEIGSTPTAGAFAWTADGTDRASITLQTLLNPTTSGTDNVGPMANFDPGQSYSWTFVRWATTYAGPTADAALNAATVFDTTGFNNPVGGSFGWHLDTTARTLSLTYSAVAVPEPTTLALAGLAAAGLVFRQRRQRT